MKLILFGQLTKNALCISKVSQSTFAAIFVCAPHEMYGALYTFTQKQWELKFRRLDFEWSKRGWVANSLDFEWDLKSGSLTI